MLSGTAINTVTFAISSGWRRERARRQNANSIALWLELRVGTRQLPRGPGIGRQRHHRGLPLARLGGVGVAWESHSAVPRYSVAVPVDLGQLYHQGRLRITDLVSDQESDRPVAATPLWTVHDVVAHMAGVMEDVRTGNMEGVTTDPWTAAQIERGRSKSVSDLLDQWARDAVGPEMFLSTPEGAPYFRAVVDVMTHLADLLTAFGRPVDLPPEFMSWITPLLIETFNQEATSDGLPLVEVEAPDFEVFRGRLGRRTETEVRSFEWSVNPEPYLDTWFIFGRAEATLGEICASS